MMRELQSTEKRIDGFHMRKYGTQKSRLVGIVGLMDMGLMQTEPQ